MPQTTGPKSAIEVMQDAIFAGVMDAMVALKAASKGLPNAMVRDINAMHPNAALADLAPEVQAAINESVRQAFQRFQREGYVIGPATPAAPPPRPRPGGPPSSNEVRRRGPLRPGRR